MIGKTPLDVARAYYKQGIKELTGHNDAPLIYHFLREAPPADWPAGKDWLNWCAAFVLCCFSEASEPIPGNFYENRSVAHLITVLDAHGWRVPVEQISRGDIVTFERAGGGHVGIASICDPQDIWSYEANVGNRLALVSHRWPDPKCTGVFRRPA